MARYLISFDDGAMTFLPEERPAVADAAHAVTREAMAAGVWVLGAGVHSPDEMSVVDTDGSVSDGPPAAKAFLGGFTIVDVPTRDEALRWAAKLAVACRCAQEVRELMHDPELEGAG